MEYLRGWSVRPASLGFAVAATILGATPARAADSCSGTAAFDFNSRWDTLFATAAAWQFPNTNTCLSPRSGLGSRKLDGKLNQRNGQLWFGLDGAAPARSELRSKPLVGRNGSMSGKVFVRIATEGRKFTVAQMLNGTPSLQGGGQDPILRLEIDNGVVELIYYLANGAPSQAIGNIARVAEGSSITFSFTQWPNATATEFDIEARVNGAIVLPRRRVTGYDSAKSYFKAGCYVNNNGGSGCRSSFEALTFDL